MCFQSGVVDLAYGDLGAVERATVDGEPASIAGANLVGDDDMGVQIWVARTCIAVGESSSN